MAVTVTEKTSWFGKIGNSIKGMVFGLLLFVAAFPLLFWNEGRSLNRYKSLTEGAGDVITVDHSTVDSVNEGSLVHMSGNVETSDILTDSEFNISVSAIKLKRTVQMYQWIEDEESTNEDKLGGGEETVTTYSYHKGWSENLVDSSSFQESGHDNPSSMPYESVNSVAENVSLGAFDLSSSLISSINSYSSYSVTSEDLASLSISNLKLNNGEYYIGDSISSPSIGDLKISFEIVKPDIISVVAKQSGNVLSSYKTNAGGEIELLQYGEVSAEAMFESAIESNKLVTWLVRVGGAFLMFFGLSMVLKPLSAVGDVIPFIGDIIGFATGLVAGIVAIVLSLVTIAIAWIAVRPILAISLLVVAAVLLGLGITMIKKKKK